MSDLLDRFPAKFVKTRQPGNARYIEHSQVRQRLIAAQADGDLTGFEWRVLDLRDTDDGWLVHGRLTVIWPDGKELVHEVIGDPDRNAAASESRAFVRAVAFLTGVGLQAWTGEDGYWLDKRSAGE
jgi:hypothetical protein